MQAFNCSYAELLELPAQVVRDHLTFLRYQKEHSNA